MKTTLSQSLLARAAALALALAALLPAQEARLANVSTLTRVGTGADVLTAGFVITGTVPRQVVIRAVGPTLGAAPFNVPGVLANPQLTVYGPDSSTRVAATNDDWAAANAPTFASVGAFALQASSRDAAVVATLAPGAYTAQVSGVGDTVGTALVEVYEVGTSGGRFVNLSTRAQVAGTTAILTPGFVITPGTGTRKLLIRAAGPALTPLGLAGALANPSLTLINTSTRATVATNDNRGTPVAPPAASAQVLALAFAQAGAFAFPANSQDAALLVDLPAGNYTVQVSGVANSAGIALAEVYDLTPASPPTVSIAASRASADETGGRNGEVTFTRSGLTFEPLTVRYGIGGSAVNAFDYVALSGSITIPAGAATAPLPLLPNPDLQNEGTDTVVITVLAGTGYAPASQASATVTIADSSATLYVASISPERVDSIGARSSGARGHRIVLHADDLRYSRSRIQAGRFAPPVKLERRIRRSDRTPVHLLT